MVTASQLSFLSRSRGDDKEEDKEYHEIADRDDLSRLERGEAGLGGGGAAAPKTRRLGSGRCVSALRRGIDSLCDKTAWRTLDRLVFVFRFTQYIDLVTSVVSVLVTFSLGRQYSVSRVQIPLLSMGAVIFGVALPWLGIFASFHMRQYTLQFVVLCAVFFKVGYSAALLVYLLRDTGADTREPLDVVMPEVVMCGIRIAVGLAVICFGAAAASKMERMHRTRKTVLVVGLDGAGKSLLVDGLVPKNLLKLREAQTVWEVHPTAGLSMHEFQKFDGMWRLWDMSGSGRARALWPSFFASASAIVFVVDASDLKRLSVVKREFKALVAHPDVQRARPLLLVLLNKTDLPARRRKTVARITAPQLAQLLQVDSLAPTLKVRVQASSGLEGSGMDEGLQWISLMKSA